MYGTLSHKAHYRQGSWLVGASGEHELSWSPLPGPVTVFHTGGKGCGSSTFVEDAEAITDRSTQTCKDIQYVCRSLLLSLHCICRASHPLQSLDLAHGESWTVLWEHGLYSTTPPLSFRLPDSSSSMSSPLLPLSPYSSLFQHSHVCWGARWRWPDGHCVWWWACVSNCLVQAQFWLGLCGHPPAFPSPHTVCGMNSTWVWTTRWDGLRLHRTRT